MRSIVVSLVLVGCSQTASELELPTEEDTPNRATATPAPASTVVAATSKPESDAGVPPSFSDDFEASALSPHWTAILEAGSVKIATGGHGGAQRLATAFGSLPKSGRARISAALSLPAAGARAWVKVPVDGYPPRFGIATLRLAGGTAVDVVAIDEGHSLALSIAGQDTKVGSITLGEWTCFAVSVEKGHVRSSGVDLTVPDAPVVSLELGLAYAGGANPNASMGISFDDVLVTPTSAHCD